MSETSRQRAEDFLKISDQFQLGVLTTESSHPVTANLSEIAKESTAEALDLLFEVDCDVVRKYRQWVETGQAARVRDTLRDAILAGGKVFFTGCGSTGRLSIQLNSIWRDFWQKQRALGVAAADDFEDRAFSVMAGGDFALIKAVEGFEDFTQFGKQQIADLGVGKGDVVFAITEGGETSFVIGTAWQGLESGAKVYFVYNNPDDILCEYVTRSREVIQEPRIEKINLTTGPMGITGSTRMQATTIQLCVMLTILEMVLRDIVAGNGEQGERLSSDAVPSQFLTKLSEMHATLRSPEFLGHLAKLTELEEGVYRAGRKNNYFANKIGIDVLTDTTERSPTYCTPPFRKFDDTSATESWAFLYVPIENTRDAWRHIIKRDPKCVEWPEDQIRQLVSADKADRTIEIVKNIGPGELMRFRVGTDGIANRPLGSGDSAVGIVTEDDIDSILSPDGFTRLQLQAASAAGAKAGLIYIGRADSVDEVNDFLGNWAVDCVPVLLTVPETDFLLDGVTRAGLKMMLNSLSTCTMVRLGRVMGNYMIWVVASNLKLIDRATRYIQKLTGMPYIEACHLLFEVVEYVEPRMKADQVYPPVVGVSVMRRKYGLTNEEAEKKLMEEIGR